MRLKVQTGLDSVEKSWPAELKNARIGLLVHSASINFHLEHALNIAEKSKKFRLTALFGPQHGIHGQTQDNMVEWSSYKDRKTGLPVFSLYGKTRIPTPEMLKNLDAMVIDLQDVGARYYTYIWSMALAMKACMYSGKSVVVLDRPNPIGGHLVEGPVLRQGFTSFVGLHSLPARHGMTMGEISSYIHDCFYKALSLHVIPLRKWRRNMWFDMTNLPWALPSPNMPTLDTATVYPGMCLLEGTNLSEGRGTTKPFEIFGAPYIEPEKLILRLKSFRLPGVIFRPLFFTPAFQKHSGKLCGGAQIHVTDREKYRPFKTAVAIVKAIREMYPEEFAWRMPPYEYEERILPIDILAGSDSVRNDIEKGTALKTMESGWNRELREFDKKVRRKYLLYK